MSYENIMMCSVLNGSLIGSNTLVLDTTSNHIQLDFLQRSSIRKIHVKALIPDGDSMTLQYQTPGNQQSAVRKKLDTNKILEYIFDVNDTVASASLSLSDKTTIASVFSIYVELEDTPEALIVDSLASSPHPPSPAQGLSHKAAHKLLSVDIIVSVHNGLTSARKCLESLLANTKTHPYKLIIINRGSDQETSDFLKHLQRTHQERVELINLKRTCGYTHALNQGLHVSRADYVVFLSSTTIVPFNWLDKIIRCAESDPNIGIVGPFSNAADAQSIPVPPVGFDVNDLQWVVQQTSRQQYPRLPLLNGFCFAVKRSLISSIGLLDEESFPGDGGVEAIDYCIRAVTAGFSCALAEDVYVHNADAGCHSYSLALNQSNQDKEALLGKYGSRRIEQCMDEFRNNVLLDQCRTNIARHVEHIADKTRSNKPSILFVLPVKGGGGGAHSVLQEAFGMRHFGYDVKVAMPMQERQHIISVYHDFIGKDPEMFVFFENKNWRQLASFCKLNKTDIIVATIFSSVELVKNVKQQLRNLIAAYYVQDYEPLFFEPQSKNWNKAYESYKLIPDILLFAKTEWLCETVKEKHGLHVHKVRPSIDTEIYNLRGRVEADVKMRICAMIRPATPRRGAERTMRVLSDIQNKYQCAVQITVFGCDNESIQQMSIVPFRYTNRGILNRNEVARLLKESDIFIDLSDYQAFGRTGLEAMACGCVSVLPKTGGVYEYAVNKTNCLIIDSLSEHAATSALIQLIDNSDVFSRMKNNAIAAASVFSIENAVISELQLFNAAFNRLNNRKVIQKKCFLLYPRTKGGFPTGTAHIRLLQPIKYFFESCETCTGSVSDFFAAGSVDTLIVQRDVIANAGLAHDLISHCQRQGIRLIYELDDYLFDVDDTSRSLIGKEKATAALEICKAANVVTVSTENLKEKIITVNPNTVCIRNNLDADMWKKNQAKDYFLNPVRLLYMGTYSHKADFEFLFPVLKKIKQRLASGVEIDIVGVVPPAEQDAYADVCNFINLPDQYAQFVDLMNYNNTWHIGLAPLLDTKFNTYKSDIKFVDYSFMRLATICSNHPAYAGVSDEMILKTENSHARWLNAIESLIDNRPLLASMASTAHGYVKANRSLKNTIEQFALLL